MLLAKIKLALNIYTHLNTRQANISRHKAGKSKKSAVKGADSL
jgi:hypothetical protein